MSSLRSWCVTVAASTISFVGCGGCGSGGRGGGGGGARTKPLTLQFALLPSPKKTPFSQQPATPCGWPA